MIYVCRIHYRRRGSGRHINMRRGTAGIRGETLSESWARFSVPTPGSSMRQSVPRGKHMFRNGARNLKRCIRESGSAQGYTAVIQRQIDGCFIISPPVVGTPADLAYQGVITAETAERRSRATAREQKGGCGGKKQRRRTGSKPPGTPSTENERFLLLPFPGYSPLIYQTAPCRLPPGRLYHRRIPA